MRRSSADPRRSWTTSRPRTPRGGRARRTGSFAGRSCIHSYGGGDPAGPLRIAQPESLGEALGLRGGGPSCRAVGAAGELPISLPDFYRGFFATSLREDELVRAVEVPLPAPGTGAAYAKFVTRSSGDRPCVGATAVVRLDARGRCE